MNRREFLKIGSGSAILALLPGMAFALPASLLDSCREGAKKREIAWTPRVDSRVREEIREICLARGQYDLLSLANAVRRLRMDGIQFAPGWGRTPSSLVSYLLGMSEIDPFDFNLPFDAVLPTNRGCRMSLSFALDARHVRGFLGTLGDSNPSSWEIARGYPTAYNTMFGPIEVIIVPLASPPRMRPQGRDDYRPFALGEYLEKFPRRPGESKKDHVMKVATALAHFRPGPATSGIALEFATHGQEGIDHKTYRNPVFREDLAGWVTERTGVSRLESARYIKAAAAKREDHLQPLRKKLERSARRNGLWTEKTPILLRDLEWRSGYAYSKGHAVGQALMLLGKDPLKRESATALSTIGNGEDDHWADDLFGEYDALRVSGQRLCHHSRVSSHKWRTGTLEERDYHKLLLGAGNLNKLMAAPIC